MKISELTGLPLIDESSVNQLLSAHPSLQPRPSRASQHPGPAGITPNSSRGSGTEFDDLRPFQPGDDPKQIDWRATARSQQTLVRSYLSEFQQPLYLVVDRSSSMRFGSQRQLKVRLAAHVALSLVGIFHQAGREVGALLLNPKLDWYPATTNLESLRQFAAAAVAACPPTANDNLEWHRIFALLIEQLPRGAKLILISDFLNLDARAVPQLGELAQKVELGAVLISDPLEQRVPTLSGLRLDWGAASVRLDSPETVAQFNQLQEQQRNNLKSHFSRAGVELSEILTSTESLTDSWLGRLL